MSSFMFILLTITLFPTACYEGGNIGSWDGGDGASVGKDESDNCWEFESDRRCTSCVTGSQCSTEDGTCLCESQFADMACHKGNLYFTLYLFNKYNYCECYLVSAASMLLVQSVFIPCSLYRAVVWKSILQRSRGRNCVC